VHFCKPDILNPLIHPHNDWNLNSADLDFADIFVLENIMRHDFAKNFRLIIFIEFLV